MFPSRLANLLLIACPVHLCGSSISGAITDPSSAAVPIARIELEASDGKARRETFSTLFGTFEFLNLEPGRYVLRVEAAGFKRAIVEGVEVNVRTPATVNIRLELGSAAETVTVSGADSPLNTRDATQGNPFDSRQITQLPLEGRNVLSLLSLQPGVVFVGENSLTQRNTINEYDPDQRNGSVNGSRSDQASVTLDGVETNDNEKQVSYFSAVRITTESIQEFRVVTAGPTADLGRSSGAQVALVTRSGGNDAHGAVFHTHRNTLTSANDFFNNRAGVPRPKLIRNVFGAAMGGPVSRNRAFLFGSYEGRRDASQAGAIRVVPNQDFRNGLIRYRNTANQEVTLSPAQFTELDPLRRGATPAVLDVFRAHPAPNDTSVGDGLNYSGFRFNAPIRLGWDTATARFDLVGSARHNLFLRGNIQRDRSLDDPLFPGQPPQFTRANNSRGLAAGDTWAVSGSLIHSFRYGLTHVSTEDLGASLAPQYSFGSGIGSPVAATRTRGRVNPSHNIADDVAWSRSGHSVNAGGNFRFIRNRRFTLESTLPLLVANPAYLTDRGAELQPAGINPAFANNYVVAALGLMGIFPQANAYYNWLKDGTLLAPGEPIRRRFATDEYEFYLQDSWRARRNLTLTFGLRYGIATPVHEQNGNQTGPTIPLTDWYEQRSGGLRISNELLSARFRYAGFGKTRDRDVRSQPV